MYDFAAVEANKEWRIKHPSLSGNTGWDVESGVGQRNVLARQLWSGP